MFNKLNVRKDPDSKLQLSQFNFMKNSLLIALALLLTFSINSQSITEKVQEQEVKIYSNEVYFDFALYDIRPDADSTLREIVAFLEDQEGYYIRITAHTDFVGTNSNNMTLSINRSNAVKDWLRENGIPDNIMKAKVYGEEQPQATNQTDQGRQLNRRATVDIFKIKRVTSITGTVIDEETGDPLEATVILHTKDSRDSVQTDEKGQFQSLVPLDAVVGIDIYTKCYFLKTKMFKTKQGMLSDMTFKMSPAKVGKASDIDNLYFVGNQDTLLSKSEPELPKILRFMQLNDCLNVEIAGHVNVPNSPPVREHSWEYGLSVRRAKRVHNYLVEKGISKERIIYKGYGNWEMRYPKGGPEWKQSQNRRVEIRVLESTADCLCDKIWTKTKNDE